MTQDQMRDHLLEAREDLALLQAEWTATMNRLFNLTTMAWEATQPDAAPTYSPTFRRRAS